MGTLLDMKEWKEKLKTKKEPDFSLLNRLIEGQEKLDYGEVSAHMKGEIASWYGMKPPAPSISHLGGIIEYDEDIFPPPRA